MTPPAIALLGASGQNRRPTKVSMMMRPRRAFVGISWVLLSFFYVPILLAAFRVIETGWLQRPSPLNHSMPDFVNLWSAGRLARSGGLESLYSSELFNSWKESQFGAPLFVKDWIYPPTALLIGVPLSFLPLTSAFLTWNVATLAVAVFLLRYAHLPWPIVVMGLLSPASWNSVLEGQYGVIVGAFLIASLLVGPHYPIRAGAMLGMATIKPQQGIIVLMAWLATGSWRAIAAAAITSAIMAASVSLAFGLEAWTLFFTQSGAMARTLLEALPPQPYIDNGVSVFWMARTMGLGVDLSYMAQAIVAMAALAFAYRAWRIPDADPLARMAFSVLLSLLTTPYGYNSDMVAYSIAVATIVALNNWRLRIIDVFLWLWPGYFPALTTYYHLQLTPLVVGVAAVLSWRQIRRKVTDRGFA